MVPWQLAEIKRLIFILVWLTSVLFQVLILVSVLVNCNNAVSLKMALITERYIGLSEHLNL